MRFLSLSVGDTELIPPSGVPTGGLGAGEAGSGLIQIAIQLIFIIGFVLAVAFIIISGIQWIISGGDKEKIQKAKGRLTYSIVGLIVIAGAFFIVSTVISLFGGNPLYFLNTRTAQEACPETSTYVDCGGGGGGGRFICGTTDRSACNTTP